MTRASVTLKRLWPSLDPRLFVLWCTICTGFVASLFISAMLDQTGGEWSAPLDDVFIHFDYARSTARGRPFEWCAGNGYSSGNTSVTYPFVLALGWGIGFRDLHLMAWAVGVACVSIIVFFIAASRYTRPLGPWAKYIIPPAVLSLGALDWSLVSGMEVAFHLGVWGCLSLLYDRFERLTGDPVRALRAALLMGLASCALVLTRPESVVCVAVFAVAVVVSGWRLGWFRALRFGVATGLPPAVAMALMAYVNRMFTGEWSQAGALAKVALYNPYMNGTDKWEDWLSHFEWVLSRVVHHHFAEQAPRGYAFSGIDKVPYGYLVPAMALVPLFVGKVRPRAAILWANAAAWSVVVSLNGQVRWQNERYIMSAVAWLLLLAALGVATLVSHFGETLRGRIAWGARLAVAGLAVLLYWDHQRPKFNDQVWFFARASRNIRDQQWRAGKALRALDPPPRRILVGDAGAVIYGSDRPGLDIIGLGGYHDYPFARATKYGLGSTLELIERMEVDQRPDYMAIYPGWWGDLPIVFGRYVAEVPVVGNVICGGSSKVIYRADWTALDGRSFPRSMADREVLVDEVDVADLMSERPHQYEHPRPHMGFVVWRVLPDPGYKKRDLFDAGRIIPATQRESFQLKLPVAGGRLIARTIATRASSVRVSVDGQLIGELDVMASDTWSEPSVVLPGGLPAHGRVELQAEGADWVNFHVWVVESR